jgi:uncharacterized repeat protein (TIGR01451 family)
MTPERAHPRSTRRRTSWLLALVTVLLALAPASGARMNTPAGGTGGADLKTRTRDTPDPVTEQNNVKYTVRVTNRGPETATNVLLRDTPPAGSTLVSAEGDRGFDCEAAVITAAARGSTTIECTVDALSPGEFARASIVVRTPGVSEGSEVVSNHATASADQVDPRPGNNDDVEETTVEPRSPDESAGWIPSEGGSMTTDVGEPGPDAQDFTVLRMRFGPGPGGPAALRELDCTGSIFAPCIGNVAELLPPEGYDRVIGVLLESGTIDPGTPRRDLEVLYQKRDGDPVVSLPRCRRDPAPPCIRSIKRLERDPATNADDVLRFRVLFTSDPKLAPR